MSNSFLKLASASFLILILAACQTPFASNNKIIAIKANHQFAPPEDLPKELSPKAKAKAKRRAKAGFWLDTQSSDCKIWINLPKTEVTANWSGACLDGFASGEGKLVVQISGVELERREGTWIKGKQNGPGAMISGLGVNLAAIFKDGEAHGKGLMIAENGDRYEGEYRFGWRRGIGTYHYSNGSIYRGYWIYDEPNGEGLLTLPDGAQYHGPFYNGRMHGEGLCKRFDNDGSLIHESCSFRMSKRVD